ITARVKLDVAGGTLRVRTTLHRFHIHRDTHCVLSTADEDALDRTDVAEVAAPAERDVASARGNVIGRIDIKPAVLGQIDRNPGVRDICANHFRLPGRRFTEQVTADVAGGQAERTQTSDLEMGKVLAYAAPQTQDFDRRRIYAGCLGIKRKFVVNAVRQIQ